MSIKNNFIILILGLSLTLISCHRGADNMPQLSNMMYMAFKENNFKKLQKVTPDKENIMRYLELYELNQYKNDDSRKMEAGSREETMITTLKNQFSIIRGSKDIDWESSKLIDYQYEENETKEGYSQSLGSLKIQSSKGTKLVSFDAKKVEGKWFLVDRMEIKENVK